MSRFCYKVLKQNNSKQDICSWLLYNNSDYFHGKIFTTTSKTSEISKDLSLLLKQCQIKNSSKSYELYDPKEEMSIPLRQCGIQSWQALFLSMSALRAYVESCVGMLSFERCVDSILLQALTLSQANLPTADSYRAS